MKSKKNDHLEAFLWFMKMSRVSPKAIEAIRALLIDIGKKGGLPAPTGFENMVDLGGVYIDWTRGTSAIRMRVLPDGSVAWMHKGELISNLIEGDTGLREAVQELMGGPC